MKIYKYKINKYIIWFPKKKIFLKLFNLLKFYISKYLKIKIFNYLPITMDIEPTTGCNFRCTMCQVSSPDFISKNEFSTLIIPSLSCSTASSIVGIC